VPFSHCSLHQFFYTVRYSDPDLERTHFTRVAGEPSFLLGDAFGRAPLEPLELGFAGISKKELKLERPALFSQEQLTIPTKLDIFTKCNRLHFT